MKYYEVGIVIAIIIAVGIISFEIGEEIGFEEHENMVDMCRGLKPTGSIYIWHGEKFGKEFVFQCYKSIDSGLFFGEYTIEIPNDANVLAEVKDGN